jgi:adenylate cyclase
LDHGFDVDQVRNTPSPILLPANRVYGDDGTLVSARTVADSSGSRFDIAPAPCGRAGSRR